MFIAVEISCLRAFAGWKYKTAVEFQFRASSSAIVAIILKSSGIQVSHVRSSRELL